MIVEVIEFNRVRLPFEGVGLRSPEGDIHTHPLTGNSCGVSDTSLRAELLTGGTGQAPLEWQPMTGASCDSGNSSWVSGSLTGASVGASESSTSSQQLIGSTGT
jgi:hypothetical protein